MLVLVPGPNTVIILAHTLGRGRAAGLATVAGVELGTVVHTIAAAVGLSTVLSASAASFAIVKVAGVMYLLVAGIRMLLLRAPQRPSGLAPVQDVAVAFRRAFWTNVLNPKVALFFVAFLPQFARPEHGHLVLQFITLGLIVSGVGLSFGSALVLGAGALSLRIRRSPSFDLWQGWITGAIFVGLAVRLALS